MKTLLLIDANSLIHRAFHALPPLTAYDGRPAQALYGVSSILLKLWREDKPEYAAALFDRPEPTFRKEQYAEYKAQRPKAVDELVSQIIEARDLFPRFGVPIFELPGFEADDLIATLAEKFKDEPDLRIVILTGDMDTLQMVGGNIFVRALRKGVSDAVLYDETAVRERYGIAPKQLIDYKSLVGDASDNVKGVSGIGPKTAVELLQNYGTVEKALIELEPSSRVAVKLNASHEQIALSKMLVTLRKDAPMRLAELDDLRVKDRTVELENYFKELGFDSLVKRLHGETTPEKQKKEKPKKSPENRLF